MTGRPQPVALWALSIIGEFDGARHHICYAADEQNARERAAWWRNYRTDVEVSVVSREHQGAPWTATS